MALLYFDGFELYPDNVAEISFSPGAAISAIVTDGTMEIGAFGRDGGRGLAIHQSDAYWQYSITPDISELVMGVLLKLAESGDPEYGLDADIIAVHDAVNWQLRFFLVGTEIQVRRDTTLLGTTSGAGISYNQEKYVEIKMGINDSTGYVVINVDGVEVLSLSGVDTLHSGSAYVKRIWLRGAQGARTMHYDDFYLCDLTGTKNNDFLGPCRVDVVRPNGAGTHTDFTPSAGSNFQNVDDAPAHDGTTTYNESADIGDKDSYALASLPTFPLGTTIHGIKNTAVLAKTDVGAKGAKVLAICGATEHASSEFSITTTPSIYHEILENNPDDDEAFVDADIAALESGVEDAS